MGSDDRLDMSFFPGMTIDVETKLRLLRSVVKLLTSYNTVVTLRQHAAAFREPREMLASHVSIGGVTDVDPEVVS
jgi:hypothetical protein